MCAAQDWKRAFRPRKSVILTKMTSGDVLGTGAGAVARCGGREGEGIDSRPCWQRVRNSNRWLGRERFRRRGLLGPTVVMECNCVAKKQRREGIGGSRKM